MTTSPNNLNHCDCCVAGVPDPERHNRPGQPALSYRRSTHSTFLQRMIARLHSQSVTDSAGNQQHPLQGLFGRAAGDDPGIALLDAAAMVGDVLTFYQERIANEGFLGTATERRSVLEIARSIGYELNPGVAAGAYLAFTVSDAPTMPRSVTVPQGSGVQSIPPQGQLPQTFETSAELTARVELNAFRPRLSVAQSFTRGITQVYLKGVSAQLQPGDTLLLVGDERLNRPRSERWDLRVITEVATNPVGGYTLVSWRDGLGHENPNTLPSANPRAYVLRQRAALFGYNAPDWRVLPVNVQQAYDPGIRIDANGNGTNVSDNWPSDYFRINTVDLAAIDLDAAYPRILADSWVALEKPSFVELYRVQEVIPFSRTDFTLSGKSARLKLDTNRHLDWFGLRDTVVHAQSEELELAEAPLTHPVYGDEITLDGLLEDLAVGQALIFSGKPAGRAEVSDLTHQMRVGWSDETREGEALTLVSAAGTTLVTLAPGDLLEPDGPPTVADDEATWSFTVASGSNYGVSGYLTLPVGSPALRWHEADAETETVSEVVTIEEVSHDGERTTLTLTGSLSNAYDRTSLVIHGNVVPATHGETVTLEVLGSGDGASTNQTFQLRKSPLTYVSAATASGVAGTLKVRVNDVLWAEVSSLYGLGTRDESYTVRISDDGKARIIFGDGKSGARLPTGTENVKATYRSGIGLEGEVEANSLSLLKSRPKGLQTVNNPLSAAGAADPEALSEARSNAPRTVLTLDRIVSRRDFEDFSRAFAGIGKSQAVDLWHGEDHLVHLTVTTGSGVPLANSPDLYPNLVDAIKGAYDPRHTFVVQDYQPLTFNISAKVLVDSRYVAADVLASVKAQLQSEFDFESRSLSQPVTSAQVIQVIHQVAGVIAADLDQLYQSDDPNGPFQITPAPLLPASQAYLDADTNVFYPAQLLELNAEGITLTQMDEAS